jgi:hypothetical protein
MVLVMNMMMMKAAMIQMKNKYLLIKIYLIILLCKFFKIKYHKLVS